MKKFLILPLSLMLAACTQQAIQLDASVTPFRDGKQCAISFTYDDGMLCQYTDVAPELEKRGFRGTFWIIGANMDSDVPDYPWMAWDQVADLARRGHELSNHTWNHPDLSQMSMEEGAEEIDGCLDKAEALIETLFNHFIRNKDQLPPEYLSMLDFGERIDRVVCDYVGAMTDHYAISLYEELYVPKSWHG